MAIKKLSERPRPKKIEIDLTGEKGNAFYLLGLAKSLADKTGQDYEQISREMKSSDYENLIQVFDKYFGKYVDLYR